MAHLSVYLPPFAGDYSGVCSALFDLNCLIIMNDASCCTRNYVNYDESRWTITKKTTFCSELRTMDAVLGDDERVIRQTVEAAGKLNPDFIAVLGSPVPAIIGMDMKGIAYEIEQRCGVPVLGFDTTGFSYYHKGIEAAFLTLLKRFTLSSGQNPVHAGVNILGVTPLDFSANDNNLLFRRLVEDSGLQLVSSWAMQCDLEQIRQAASARVNWVVSQSGWSAAVYMHEKFGIPYVVGTPLGCHYAQSAAEALQQTANDKISRVLHAESEPSVCHTDEGTTAMLIIGDQVIANSLRASLRRLGCKLPITVASFFAMVPELSLPGDLLLKSEKQLIELLRSGRYAYLLADPLIASMPAAARLQHRLLPHPAISSNLYWNQVPLFIGEEMENLLQSWIF